MGNFTRDGVLLSGGGHLSGSAFDHSSIFQRKKHFVNIEHQLKLKLV